LAFDVVKQITEIEKEGEQLIKNAQLHSAEILKEAQNEAEAIVQRARKEAEVYYNKVIVEFENEASELSKPILENSQVVKEKLGKISGDVMDRALNMVIERIVNSHGDS
jgi:V/A-type H+/Na+-transporting ATPase subunit G/H